MPSSRLSHIDPDQDFPSEKGNTEAHDAKGRRVENIMQNVGAAVRKSSEKRDTPHTTPGTGFLGIGERITVVRTSGDAEHDWTLLSIDESGALACVCKEQENGFLSKTVHVSDLEEWNARFALGESVTIRIRDQEDNGWIVTARSPERSYTVTKRTHDTRKDMVFREEQLRRWNRR